MPLLLLFLLLIEYISDSPPRKFVLLSIKLQYYLCITVS